MEILSSSILRTLIKTSNQRILIPFYHAVSNSVPNFIGDLYPPRKIIDFEHDLDILLEFYEPISLAELISLVNSGEKLTKNYFHLTFDDGLANFYNIVAPILLKRNLSATIFLNADFVDNKKLFYRYKASLLLGNYNKSESLIKSFYYDFMNENNFKGKEVSKFLLGINYKNKEVLDDLAEKLGFSFVNFLNEEQPYLNKTQIIELIDKGFSFGAHSVDHPFYPELSLENQLKQTIYSLKWLKTELNLNYKAFSFPFTDYGVSNAFYEEMGKDKLLDISFGTSGIKVDSVKNNFQRIPFEYANKNLKQFLINEYLKYIIKIPLGKSIMKRKNNANNKKD